MKKRFKRISIFAGLFFAVVFISTSQLHSWYLALSPQANVKASQQIKGFFNNLESPITITIFSTKQLIEELQISSIVKWTESLATTIEIKEVNPFKSPEIADHYDITTDGIIVFEFDDRRLDVDIIELILTNESFSVITVQNHILKSLIQLTQPVTDPIILIHNKPTSVLEDTQAMGLSSFGELLNKYHFTIEERTINDYFNAPQAHSLIIFHELGPSAMPFKKALDTMFKNELSYIVFSHPKYASFMNQFFTNIQFSESIIEDENMHILNYPNQLLINYQTTTGDALFGILPFSSFITSNYDANSAPILAAGPDATSSETYEKALSPPFEIGVRSGSKVFINNHLILSNFWISQGANAQIIIDIILQSLQTFPVISPPPSSNATIPLTQSSLLTYFFLLVGIPVIIISSISMILTIYFKSKN